MKRFFVFCIRMYQKNIKYLFPNKKPMCRFYPTCSNYAIQAIERFGAFKGVLLFMLRFLRCNPFFPGGFDPVPEKRKPGFK